MEFSTWQNFVCFLQEWQTLIGAFVGALLPVIIAFLIQPIRNWYKKREDHAETLRRIEVYTSQVMNDTHDRMIEWGSFIERVRSASQEEVGSSIGIFLTNLPSSVPIIYDNELIQEKVYDPILHNFLLNLGKWIRGFNALLTERERAFLELQNETRSEISHVRSLRDMEPRDVMKSYNNNLVNYTNTTEKSLYGSIKSGIETCSIVKISTEIIRKGKFDRQRFQYRQGDKFKNYTKLIKLPVEDYSTFQDRVVDHFKVDTLNYFRSLINRSQDKEKLMKLFNLSEEDKKIIRNS